MTVSLHGRDQDRHPWFQPLAANAVTSLPQHDERLANSFVVCTITHWRLLLDPGSFTQDPGSMLAVVCRQCHALVEDRLLLARRQVLVAV